MKTELNQLAEALYRLNKRAKENRDDLFNKTYLQVSHPDTGEKMLLKQVKEDLSKWIRNCEADLLNWDDEDEDYSHDWASCEKDLEESVEKYESLISSLGEEVQSKKEALKEEKERIYDLKNQVLLKLKECNEIKILDSHYFPVGEFTLVKIKNTNFTFHIESYLIAAPEESECKNLDLIDSECESGMGVEEAYKVVNSFLSEFKNHTGLRV